MGKLTVNSGQRTVPERRRHTTRRGFNTGHAPRGRDAPVRACAGRTRVTTSLAAWRAMAAPLVDYRAP